VDEPSEAAAESYVYRRVAPKQHDKNGKVLPALFELRIGESAGLSVYDASLTTPRQALQQIINSKKNQLASAEDEAGGKIRNWLVKYPDVESLVRDRWRVYKMPVSVIKAMGFGLGEPDASGHLNILGTDSKFKDKSADFTELQTTGQATLLNEDDCLGIE